MTKASMVSALEVNTTFLGINVLADFYASLDAAKKQSMANFVLDRKSAEYHFESGV